MAIAGITISSVDTEARRKAGLEPGDTVRIWQKVVERIQEKDKVKERTRLQAFEGLVLSHKHGYEPGAMFTVRKVVDGVGVERIFPLYSPTIDKIEVLKRAKVRRAKLYHVRRKAAKEIRREMRHVAFAEKRKEVQAKLEAKNAETAEAGAVTK